MRQQTICSRVKPIDSMASSATTRTSDIQIFSLRTRRRARSRGCSRLSRGSWARAWLRLCYGRQGIRPLGSDAVRVIRENPRELLSLDRRIRIGDDDLAALKAKLDAQANTEHAQIEVTNCSLAEASQVALPQDHQGMGQPGRRSYSSRPVPIDAVPRLRLQDVRPNFTWSSDCVPMHSDVKHSAPGMRSHLTARPHLVPN